MNFKSKLRKLTLLITILMIILSACTPTLPVKSTGDLTIKVFAPSEYSNHSEIILDQLNVKVTKGMESFSENVLVSTGTLNNVSFTDLAEGNWTVDVSITDTENNIIYTGTTTTNISEGLSSVVDDIQLQKVKGDLVIKFTNAADYGITSGQIVLSKNGSQEQTANLLISNGIGTATFTDIESIDWDIYFALYSNGFLALESTDQIEVLPARVLTVSYEITNETGSLNLTVNWGVAPSQPTGLIATEVLEGIEISWGTNPESNIAGYMLYGSNTRDGIKVPLADNLLTSTSILYTSPEVGETYWFWIRAYNNDGLASDLSEPTTITYGNVSNPISGTVQGIVTDATTGIGIAGVYVATSSGEISTSTDSNGSYTLNNVVDGSEITAEMSGYSSDTRIVDFSEEGEIQTVNFALSPELNSGEVRIVLTWGEEPLDLDSHLLVPTSNIDPSRGYHVDYSSKGSKTSYPYAELDVDDTSSYGPETITIVQRYSQPYKYYVYNYSTSPAITSSEALVQVYDETGLIREFSVPTTGDGLYWYVFDIDANGNIVNQNRIQEDAPTL